jgi:hypothetical protein
MNPMMMNTMQNGPFGGMNPMMQNGMYNNPMLNPYASQYSQYQYPPQAAPLPPAATNNNAATAGATNSANPTINALGTTNAMPNAAANNTGTTVSTVAPLGSYGYPQVMQPALGSYNNPSLNNFMTAATALMGGGMPYSSAASGYSPLPGLPVTPPNLIFSGIPSPQRPPVNTNAPPAPPVPAPMQANMATNAAGQYPAMSPTAAQCLNPQGAARNLSSPPAVPATAVGAADGSRPVTPRAASEEHRADQQAAPAPTTGTSTSTEARIENADHRSPEQRAVPPHFQYEW